MKKFNPTPEQKRAIESTKKMVVVSAGAGSGKTAVLTQRIIHRLADKEHPADIDRFIVVTYTNAAAMEMRSRIAEALSEKINETLDDKPLCDHLRRQLGKLPNARVQTVHSFCLEVLRRNFSKLGLPSTFTIGTKDDLSQLREQAVDKVLDEAYENVSEGFEHLRATICEERGDKKLAGTIIDTHEKIQSLAFPQKWLEEQILCDSQYAEEQMTKWRDYIFDECILSLENAKTALMNVYEELRNSYAELCDAYFASYDYCFNFADNLVSALEQRNLKEAIDYSNSFNLPSSRAPKGTPDHIKSFAKGVRETLKKTVETVGDIIFLPSGEKITYDAAACLCRLILRYDQLFAEEKKRAGLVDFSDLEHFAIKLLSDESGNPSDIALDFQQHLQELMVDEYQDSNEVQDTIFRLIAPKEGSSFFVGDIKQSIYRFRKANPKIFAEKCRICKESPEYEYIAMDSNFRSREEVLSLCNYFFEHTMTESFGDVNYAEKGQPLRTTRSANGNYLPSELCLVDTSSIKKIITADGDNESTNEIEAQYVARRIKNMIGTATVPAKDVDGKDILRPAEASDFAILLSSYSSKAPIFKQALEKYGISAAAEVGDQNLFGTVESSIIISLLRVISNHRQDIPLLSVMRSPFFNFTAEDIASVRAMHTKGDIWDAICFGAENGNEKCKYLTEEIDYYHDAAKDISCARLLQHIYARTGAYGIFAALPAPESRKQTLDRLYEIAVKCENGAFKSCSQLVSYIDRLMAVSEESSPVGEGVQIMSIHKSKGLEFPFVFVCDLAKSFNLDDCKSDVLIHTDMGVALKYTNRSQRIRVSTIKQKAISMKISEELKAEELRKLYVAMTRAREKLFLVISSGRSSIEKMMLSTYEGSGEDPQETWIRAQNSAAKWLMAVLFMHPGASLLRNFMPSFHFSSDTNHNYLDCDYSAWREESCSEDIETKQVFENFESPKNEALFDTYLALSERSYPYQRISSLSSKMTPTSMGHHKHITREIYTAAEATDGLTAAEKGTRVHDLLAKVDIAQCRKLDSCRAELEKYSMGGETPDELDVKMVCDFANSVWGQRVLSAQEVMHEYRFGLLFTPKELHIEGLEDCDDEHILVNGSIDLLIDEGESLTIVDYKTDSVKPGSEKEGAEVHRTQLELYKNAAEQIFNKPVSELTVFFLKTGVGIKL